MEKKEAKRMTEALYFLSAGPARLEVIHEKIFVSQGKMLSRQYFQRVMTDLMNEDYIQILHFREPQIKNSRFKVAIIKVRGIGYLTEKISGFEPENVRMKIPQRNQIRHELILSTIVRLLKEESLRKGYKINDIFDESAIKSLRFLKVKIKKGFFLPDLVLRITTALGKEMEFNLELDCGSRGRTYWIRKLSSFNGFSIIISLTGHRMVQLCGYLNGMRLDGKRIFCSLEDFKKVGLSFFIDKCLDPNNKKDKYLVNPPAKSNKKEEVEL